MELQQVLQEGRRALRVGVPLRRLLLGAASGRRPGSTPAGVSLAGTSCPTSHPLLPAAAGIPGGVGQALLPAPGDGHVAGGLQNRVGLALRDSVVTAVGRLALAVLLCPLVLVAVLPVVSGMPGFLVDPLMANQAVLQGKGSLAGLTFVRSFSCSDGGKKSHHGHRWGQPVSTSALHRSSSHVSECRGGRWQGSGCCPTQGNPLTGSWISK